MSRICHLGLIFFQDLVEASIRYLPLYPDDKSVHFNDDFLLKSANSFLKFAPEFNKLKETIRVITLEEVTPGNILRILMNSDIEKAVAYFSTPVESNQSQNNSD